MQLVNGYGIEGLIKMLVALTLNDVGKDLQHKLESPLISSWRDQKISPLEVHNMLTFDGNSQSDRLLKGGKKELFSQYVDKLLQTGT